MKHPAVIPDEPLANKTSLRIGGKARYYAQPSNERVLRELLQEAWDSDCPVFILGRGTNVLVSDAGYPGLVIRLSHPYWQEAQVEASGILRARSGARLKALCGLALRHQLSGFEFWEGIPGCLGGAIQMNAGAMGTWTDERLVSVSSLDFSGKQRCFDRKELHFAYRSCPNLRNHVILEAAFEGQPHTFSATIQDKLDQFAAKRKASQPIGASAGCSFKNPEGNPAGKLIDELGLKGERVGDAVVSEVHGNFILNQGEASAEDVCILMSRIQARLWESKGIRLEPELIKVGFQDD